MCMDFSCCTIERNKKNEEEATKPIVQSLYPIHNTYVKLHPNR